MRNIYQQKFRPVPKKIKVFCIHNSIKIGENVLVWNKKGTVGLALGQISLIKDGYYIVTIPQLEEYHGIQNH